MKTGFTGFTGCEEEHKADTAFHPVHPVRPVRFPTSVDALKRLQAETAAELDALLPALLDRAFNGEL